MANADIVATVRHSITDTDYSVRVVRMLLGDLRAAGVSGRMPGSRPKGRWVSGEQVFALPLTGLARKILRKQGYGPVATPR